MDADFVAKKYIQWAKTQYNFFDLEHDNTIDIQTPFIDNFGDNISFVLKETYEGLFATDEGFTIWNLETNGIKLTKKNSKRRKMLESLINLENASLSSENEILKKVDKSNVGQTIHDLTQLLLKINDLTFVSSNNTSSIFYEDAFEYFTNKEDTYRTIPSFSISGKSQLNHKIDFGFFTKSGVKLVKAHSQLRRSTIESAIVTLIDTEQYRKKYYNDTSKLCLLIDGVNDSKLQTSDNVESLKEYGIDVIDFQNKAELKNKLAY